MRADERAELDRARHWVRGHFAPGKEHLFDSWEGTMGVSPALVVAGTTIRVLPQTLIPKRVERGEVVDIYDLFKFMFRSIADARREPDIT